MAERQLNAPPRATVSCSRMSRWTPLHLSKPISQVSSVKACSPEVEARLAAVPRPGLRFHCLRPGTDLLHDAPISYWTKRLSPTPPGCISRSTSSSGCPGVAWDADAADLVRGDRHQLTNTGS